MKFAYQQLYDVEFLDEIDVLVIYEIVILQNVNDFLLIDDDDDEVSQVNDVIEVADDEVIEMYIEVFDECEQCDNDFLDDEDDEVVWVVDEIIDEAEAEPDDLDENECHYIDFDEDE